MCERWNSFANFMADMGPRPTPKHTLERIDNDGHYEPGNCRWATMREQCNNRRNTVLLTFNGETKSIANWARTHGLRYITLWQRVKWGWTPERALLTPPMSKADQMRERHAKRRAMKAAGHATSPAPEVAR